MAHDGSKLYAKLSIAQLEAKLKQPDLAVPVQQQIQEELAQRHMEELLQGPNGPPPPPAMKQPASRAVESKQPALSRQVAPRRERTGSPPVRMVGQRRKASAILLCSLGFLGFGGLHRLYTGHTVIGLIQLFTLGGAFIWQAVDLRAMIKGTYRDVDGNSLVP